MGMVFIVAEQRGLPREFLKQFLTVSENPDIFVLSRVWKAKQYWYSLDKTLTAFP